MTVKVKIENPEAAQIDPDVDIDIKPTIKVKIKPTNLIKLRTSLVVREAINGDVMIFGHNDIDIIIQKEQGKIVAFAKDLMTESVYGAESRLFEYLKKRGVIAYDSVQGGNVYGSLEAKMLDGTNTEKNNIFETMIALGDWMKEEEPYMKSSEMFDDMVNDHFVDPNEEETTELGEIPHAEEKGAIIQKNMFAPYLYGRYSY